MCHICADYAKSASIEKLEYIKTYYNKIRPHSSINCLSNYVFEKSFNISSNPMIC